MKASTVFGREPPQAIISRNNILILQNQNSKINRTPFSVTRELTKVKYHRIIQKLKLNIQISHIVMGKYSKYGDNYTPHPVNDDFKKSPECGLFSEIYV